MKASQSLDSCRFLFDPSHGRCGRGVTRKCYLGKRRFVLCAGSCNDARPLTGRSSGMLSKNTMESSEDVCHCRNCSKARSLYFIMLNKEIRSAGLV